MRYKIMIIGFYACLVLPTLLFLALRGRLDVTNYENRNYAEFPALTRENAEKVPEQLEAWYNDRLPFKNQMRYAASRLDVAAQTYEAPLMLKSGVYTVVHGKENWLYYVTHNSMDSSLAEHLGTNLYSQEELVAYTQQLRDINNYFKGKGIEYVMLIAPDKEQVYPEYLPDNYLSDADTSRMREMAAYLQENAPDVPFLYVRDTLLEYKDTYRVFYKYDTHWNQMGGYLAVQELNEYLGGEFVDPGTFRLKLLPRTEDNDLANLLGLGSYYIDDYDYKLTEYNKEVAYDRAEPDGGYQHFVADGAPDDRTVLLFGDSFRICMISPIVRSYKEVFITDSIHEAWKILDNYDIDVVVDEIVERYNFRFESEAWTLTRQ